MLSARFDRTVSTWQPQVEDMSDALGNWAAVHGRHVSRGTGNALASVGS